ncbi:MAG TPA: patatin-like phospholipase family protein [Xanthobacteraceae bacterium]|nr:patatin-like phospholipase family protein [Xanthobacteraceae bacterium]
MTDNLAETTTRPTADSAKRNKALPGQTVLVFQGGGALGAYQGGVYQALHEAGIEPDWVIGTSIGAINGAVIAGNEPGRRLERLREFWDRMARKSPWGGAPAPFAQFPFVSMPPPFVQSLASWGGNIVAQMMTICSGVTGYFSPNRALAYGLNAPVGVEQAGFYTIEALHETLTGIIDFARVNTKQPRLTVGAVNVRSGKMHYFDSRDMPLTLQHVLASGALPPAFPAIRIDGDPYWDGGIYSNTPIETVFDDYPRRDSVVFTVQMWHAAGPEPESVWQVLNRQKDIQYASRADSHIVRQEHIHQLRHIVRELVRRMPEAQRDTPEVREMAGYGCGTIMHIVRLNAPRLDHEDHLRDIDFTSAGIHARWQAGYADTMRTVERRPWEKPIDPMMGVAVHDPEAETAP